VRGWLTALLILGASAEVTVAIAQDRDDAPAPRPAASSPAPLPAPRAALPRRPARLAATLTATTRRLREALER
jgi:hypothetical protein